jgi:transcriptional regulator with XRE-family HTH domain
MARAGLEWGVRDLARHANVSTATISRLEKRQAQLIPGNLLAIRQAFEAAGVEFIEDHGVSVKPAKPAGRTRMSPPRTRAAAS